MSEPICCPCCGGGGGVYWSEELGFKLVRCPECSLLYVNPRPDAAAIDSGVREGMQKVNGKTISVRSRRIPRKIGLYKRDLRTLFPDLWQKNAPLRWVDVGAGYGETLEAVKSLAHPDSELVGVEPMQYKAVSARQRGLNIIESYLQPGLFQADVISAIDIFSHIPDFHGFLATVRTNLAPGGNVLIETGNLADLTLREEFPGELGLPDHLVFAGEKTLERYLRDAGLKVVAIHRKRIDGVGESAKSVVKMLLGRPVKLGIPYTSNFRQLMIRAQAV